MKYSEKKVVFRTNLEQMFKRTATDLDTQPTTTQRGLQCALRNSVLLPPQEYGQKDAPQNQLATCKSGL